MTAGPLNLLLIDDDEVDAMAVKRAFRHRDPALITVATDGREAWAHLRGEGRPALARPYVILLDLNMPRMNGLEFLRALREDPAHRSAPVFVLSTSAADKDRAAAYAYNVTGYVSKERAGEGLALLVDLLEAYWRLVELP